MTDAAEVRSAALDAEERHGRETAAGRADLAAAEGANEAPRGRERRLRLLADAAARLLAAADPDEVLTPVFRALSKEFGIDISFSYVVDGADGGLVLASCFGVPEDARGGFLRPAIGEGVCGRAAETGRPVLVAHVATSDDPAAPVLRAAGVRAAVSFPLCGGGGGVLGTLSFGSLGRDSFLEEDLTVLGAIANHVAVVRERLRAGERLRASEARFRLMTDAVPQIVWITDAEGRTEFFNRQWSAYTGVPRWPETAAEVAARFVHPDDAGPTMAAFGEARRTGGTFEVEHRIRSAAGGGAGSSSGPSRTATRARGRSPAGSAPR